MASHSRAVLERVSATRARLTGATSCILPSALELASLLFRRAAARPASNVRPLGHCQRLLEDSGNPCAHGHPRRCPGLVGEVSARYPVWSRWSRCIGRSSSHHPMAAASWECINRGVFPSWAASCSTQYPSALCERQSPSPRPLRRSPAQRPFLLTTWKNIRRFLGSGRHGNSPYHRQTWFRISVFREPVASLSRVPW